MLALLCLLSAFAFAQESEGSHLLSKMASYYANQKEYAIEVEYKMFKGYEKDSITEQYTTKVIKQDQRMMMSMDIYDMYVYDDFQLTVSKNDKMIYVNNKSIESNPEKIFQSINSLKLVSDVSIVSKTSSRVQISLLPKEASIFMYSKIDTTIELPDYNMLSQTLYFKDLIPFKDNKGVVKSSKGCMEITIKKYTGSVPSLPLENEIIKKQGNSFIATAKYSAYQLIDQRAKK